MRPRAQRYMTIDGLNAERDAVPWYWRLLAIGSAFLILGGYLMLQVTFNDDPALRVSKTALGIVAVVLLTAGLSSSGLLTFAVKNPLFQSEAIFLPALSSCAIGLLTVFYNFLTSSRYVWNTPALLITLAAGISTVVYGGLLIYIHRKISFLRAYRPSVPPPRPNSVQSGTITNPYQDPSYYENYIRNMFPTSSHQPSQLPGGYDPNSITEEEMQRQQMLMLLLHNDHTPSPDPLSSTFRIEWQGNDQEDPPPTHGFYAPRQFQPGDSPSSVYPTPLTAYPPSSVLTRRFTNEELLRPWDGVWRDAAPVSNSASSRGRAPGADQSQQERDRSREQREERRVEIEMGR